MATVVTSIERTCSVRDWPKELPPEALTVWLLASEKLPEEIAVILGCSKEKVHAAIALLHQRKLLITKTAQLCHLYERPVAPPNKIERIVKSYRQPFWSRLLDRAVVFLSFLERRSVYRWTSRYVHWRQHVISRQRLAQSRVAPHAAPTVSPTVSAAQAA